MIVSPIFFIFFPVTEVLEFVVYTCNIIFVCSDAHFASFRRATSIYYNSFFKIIFFLSRTPSTIMAVFPRFVSVCVISMTDHWLLKYSIIYIYTVFVNENYLSSLVASTRHVIASRSLYCLNQYVYYKYFIFYSLMNKTQIYIFFNLKLRKKDQIICENGKIFNCVFA